MSFVLFFDDWEIPEGDSVLGVLLAATVSVAVPSVLVFDDPESFGGDSLRGVFLAVLTVIRFVMGSTDDSKASP